MNIEAIKVRRAEIHDLLSVMSSKTDKWVAARNAAQNEIKKIRTELEDERQKSLLGKEHKTAEMGEKLAEAQHRLDVASAHLKELSLTPKDKDRRKELNRRFEEIKSNRHNKVLETTKEVDDIIRELREIDARDAGEEFSERSDKLYRELDGLNKSEGKYFEYRAMCEHYIIDRIDNLFARLYRDAVEFDDVEFFFEQIAEACKQRVR